MNTNKHYLALGDTTRSKDRQPVSRTMSHHSNSSRDQSYDGVPGYEKPISKHCSRKVSKKRDGSSDGGYDSAFKLTQKFKDDKVKKITRIKEQEEERKRQYKNDNNKQKLRFGDACIENSTFGSSWRSTRNRG